MPLIGSLLSLPILTAYSPLILSAQSTSQTNRSLGVATQHTIILKQNKNAILPEISLTAFEALLVVTASTMMALLLLLLPQSNFLFTPLSLTLPHG